MDKLKQMVILGIINIISSFKNYEQNLRVPHPEGQELPPQSVRLLR